MKGTMKMPTHFAAIDSDRRVIATRSSASRSAEGGTGRFGLYTHAVLLHTRTTTRNQDGSESAEHTVAIISWHNGQANAAAGLRQAHVGASYYYGANHSSYVEDASAKHGVRTLTADDPQTVKIVTHVNAELVQVVVTPKKAKPGQQVAL